MLADFPDSDRKRVVLPSAGYCSRMGSLIETHPKLMIRNDTCPRHLSNDMHCRVKALHALQNVPMAGCICRTLCLIPAGADFLLHCDMILDFAMDKVLSRSFVRGKSSVRIVCGV